MLAMPYPCKSISSMEMLKKFLSRRKIWLHLLVLCLNRNWYDGNPRTENLTFLMFLLSLPVFGC